MFDSLKNLVLVGLGINKIILEAIDDILHHNIHNIDTTDEMVEDFFGNTSCKKKKANKDRSPRDNKGTKHKKK